MLRAKGSGVAEVEVKSARTRDIDPMQRDGLQRGVVLAGSYIIASATEVRRSTPTYHFL
jgi:hypothetical protein